MYDHVKVQTKTMPQRKEELLSDIVIKFAGDSGDGMQLTGSQFTNNTALLGIDLATFPDFPAEIRAPQEHTAWSEWLSIEIFKRCHLYTRRSLRCIGCHECSCAENQFEVHQKRRKNHRERRWI